MKNKLGIVLIVIISWVILAASPGVIAAKDTPVVHVKTTAASQPGIGESFPFGDLLHPDGSPRFQSTAAFDGTWTALGSGLP
jgi:hypothetical protein